VTRALVEAAQRGDHSAFEALTIARVDRLFTVARLVLRDVELAQDAVQETLIRTWQQLPRLRDADKFDAWVHRLLINSCVDQHRSRRRMSRQIQQVARIEPSTNDTSANTADRDQLERGFRRLKPEHRAAMVLRYYAGYSADEIAEILGIPIGTAKSRIHYATEALRAALDADSRAQAALTQGRTA
jgi:RNA polymerase sigma-70 factor, ECF subfamily